MALAWVTASFLLPTAALALVFGALGDRFGRVRLLMGGSLTVACGAGVSGSSDGIHQLWTGQTLTGIGVAALIPTSLAIAVAGAPTAVSRSRGVATWTMAMSFGTKVGVLYSSVLHQHLS